jgi:hypothetical protein
MKSRILKLSMLFLTFLTFQNCQKEDIESFELIGQEIEIRDVAISNVLSDYKAFELINSEKIEFADDFVLPVKLGNDFYWNIHLTINNLTTYDSSSRHYEGHLIGNQLNIVRMSFYDNIIHGFIVDGDKSYNIQAVQSFTGQSGRNKNVILVFENKDIIKQDWNM